MAKAPNLKGIGAKHERDWFIGYIRDPRSERPKARMPSFDEAKISAPDLAALADYLSSLK